MSLRTLSSRASRRSFIKNSITVAAVLPLLGRQAFAAERKLNIYNFDTYIGPNTLETFSAATGIATRYDLYADNAELFARLREGNPGYDLICPTNDTVERMNAVAERVGLGAVQLHGDEQPDVVDRVARPVRAAVSSEGRTRW